MKMHDCNEVILIIQTEPVNRKIIFSLNNNGFLLDTVIHRFYYLRRDLKPYQHFHNEIFTSFPNVYVLLGKVRF